MLRLRSSPYALGQAAPPLQASLSANAVPFILGMVTWGVLGPTLKDLFGLGETVTRKGISAVQSRVAPPSGSRK